LMLCRRDLREPGHGLLSLTWCFDPFPDAVNAGWGCQPNF
jgi:hypothetical protein